MIQSLQKRLEPATRLCARAALVLAAGTFVTAAWSSQVAGTGIGRVVTTTTATPAPKPVPASTTSSSSKRTTHAASASHAGSAATH
jgi:cytochrome oxidase Cu insertion factor (SCO1/SenC/PrrC family)